MKETILFCGYRFWSLRIFRTIKAAFPNYNFHLVTSPEDFTKSISENAYKLVLFVGWSWIIKEGVINSKLCVCLHPSPLPKYRGGSPIQHQILSGETDSAVTLFLMDNKLDHGQLLWQDHLSLEGELDDIFHELGDVGAEGVSAVLRQYSDTGTLVGSEQSHEDATVFKRRKPGQSEILVEDFSEHTAEELYNKIRALQDPYPNAYVICKDGTRLFLSRARHE